MSDGIGEFIAELFRVFFAPKKNSDQPVKVIVEQIKAPVQVKESVWTIITSIGTLLASLTAVFTTMLTYHTVTYMKQQNALSANPIVNLLPEGFVEAKDNKFNITIVNRGISDICNINIYLDYFVAAKEKNKPQILYQVGVYSTQPNINIDKTITPNNKINFEFGFLNELKQMDELKNKQPNIQHQSFVRLKVRYERAIDGKIFFVGKVYGVAGGGSKIFLFEEGDRGYEPTNPMFDLISFREVKRTLGVNE